MLDAFDVGEEVASRALGCHGRVEPAEE